MLTLTATMRHVLTSQLHRCFNAGRAATTTQRRLKRLSDAALVERVQFHRRDGGGIPMCYAITDAGLQALSAAGRLDTRSLDRRGPRHGANAGGGREGPGPREGALRQARHDVHVTAWALALVAAVNLDCSGLRGPDETVLSPPTRSTADGHEALAPSDLRLPGGRTPHNFMRTDRAGVRVEVERFETIRPDAIVTVDRRGHDRGATDVIVELDDRLPVAGAAGKLERYDHFLAGWCLATPRYGRRADAVPLVVFVCRDRARARECARAADLVLGACRAYAGEYPLDWEYPGRERIVFVAERDIHEGLLDARGVPRVPPEVRVAAAHGDPRAGEATVERRVILSPGPDAA
jgi:Replication-relaxation